ncbi:acyltransferase family protein [Salibacterium qingdaonense]|uniref:acyltransferase family protein n=1 Tax=Salibacterium qingdaonense TaxID=266892 RepID=UPI000B09FD31|nr:acyltransferase [Salibacterium qingdaonense]
MAIFTVIGTSFRPKRKFLIVLILVGALVSALEMAVLYQPGLLDTSRVYFGTDTRALALLIGAALVLFLPTQMFTGRMADNKRLLLTLDIGGTMGLVSLCWLMWQANQYDPFLYRGGMVLQCIAAAVHPSSWITRIMGCRPLRWLGIRSYGIYIWHYPILVLTFPAAVTEGWQSIPRIFIQIAVILLIASFSWRFIEKPIRYRTPAKKSDVPKGKQAQP